VYPHPRYFRSTISQSNLHCQCSPTLNKNISIAEITTTTVPVVPLKCGIYQDMYIQTWHPIDQAFPPIRDCLGTSTNFELVRNEYVRYTLHTNGSAIDEVCD